MFDVGDTVLCVDSSVKLGMEEFVASAYFNWVRKGAKYTVRGFADNDGIVTGVWLEEIHNFPIFQPLLNRKQEPCFRLDRFVKSVEEETALEDASVEELISEILN